MGVPPHPPEGRNVLGRPRRRSWVCPTPPRGRNLASWVARRRSLQSVRIDVLRHESPARRRGPRMHGGVRPRASGLREASRISTGARFHALRRDRRGCNGRSTDRAAVPRSGAAWDLAMRRRRPCRQGKRIAEPTFRWTARLISCIANRCGTSPEPSDSPLETDAVGPNGRLFVAAERGERDAGYDEKCLPRRAARAGDDRSLIMWAALSLESRTGASANCNTP